MSTGTQAQGQGGGRGSLALPQPETDLSHRARYRWAGRLGSRVLLLWGKTLRITWDLPESVRALERDRIPFIYTFWHGHILPLSYTHRDKGFVVLVSRHGDGEIISQILHRLGYGTVRGSTTRGGLRALLHMARFGREGHPLSVTPDGPRGPRRKLQPGVLVIAQQSGVPIVPIASGARSCTYLKGWDRFEIPHPFSRVLVKISEPIHIPASVSQESLLAEWGPKVEGALLALEDAVESWIRAGKRE